MFSVDLNIPFNTASYCVFAYLLLPIRKRPKFLVGSFPTLHAHKMREPDTLVSKSLLVIASIFVKAVLK